MWLLFGNKSLSCKKAEVMGAETTSYFIWGGWQLEDKAAQSPLTSADFQAIWRQWQRDGSGFCP